MNVIRTVTTVTLIAFACSCDNQDKQNLTVMKDNNKVILQSPKGLHKNPAFSQVATVEGSYKTVYIGGQNAVDTAGNIVGKGDIEAQAKQVLANLELALQAGGASVGNIIKWNVYVLQGQPLEAAYKVFQGAMSKMENPPLITMAFVAGLGNPDYLLEMDAIAVVPGK